MKKILKKIIPSFLLNWYHFGWSLGGALLYGWPGYRAKIIGVTGTNGKSTVVFLISRILEEAGYETAFLSSVQFKIKNEIRENNLKMTMPGRLRLQRFLSQAVKNGCQYIILEVTSEGIKQHRHRFIRFGTVVLTNLTQEHLESHGGFENYRRAKGKLFQALSPQGKMVVNLDDPQAGYFLKFKAGEKWGYCFTSEGRERGIKKMIKKQNLIQAKKCYLASRGTSFIVRDKEFHLNLLGEFNITNALAALTVGLAEKVPLEKIKLALEKVKGIPGRLEIVIEEPFKVVVDYAHTPDALEKVYQTLRAVFSGRLIGVLGAAGGGRDRWKRPELGRIADFYLDEIIITNEDPYDEDPQMIIDEIAQGVKDKKPQKILDRRQAIRLALKSAREGDVVIITGKGCEPWMCLARGKKMPWDDRKIVKEEFSKLDI